MTSTPAPSTRTFQTLIQTGTIAVREGDVHEALGLFEQAAALATDDAQIAEASCMLGRCYGTLGRFVEAEGLLRDGLLRATGSPNVLARVKMQIGIVRWQQGQLDSAKAFLQDADQSFKRLGDTRRRASALGNLGMVLFSRGEYQPAIDVLNLALELDESLNDLASVAIQCNNLGECCRELGDITRAQELHQRAITLSELLRSEGLQADAWRNLGIDLAEQGLFDQAEEAIGRAREVALAFHQHDILQQTMISDAELNLLRARYPEARTIALELLEFAAGIPTWSAWGRMILGQAELAMGDPDAALTTLEAGLQDAEKSNSKMLALRLHTALSAVHTHPEIAMIHRRLAHDLMHQIVNGLTDRHLRTCFLALPFVRALLD